MSSARSKMVLVTAVLALVGGACSSTGMEEPQDGSAQASAPSQATDAQSSSGPDYDDTYNFTATTFDGDRFELAAHKGTPVVINFWESW